VQESEPKTFIHVIQSLRLLTLTAGLL
jgi:hypothetical protein